MWANGWRAANVVSLPRIATCILNFGWSPCVWKEGYRHQKNFLSAYFCALDFDDGEMTLVEAVKSFCDMTCIIGVTRSHQVEKDGVRCDRFRVVLVWEKPITDLRVYRYNMKKIIGAYPVDKKCKDGARFYFPCRDIIYVNEDGYSQEVKENVPDDFERPRPIIKAYEQLGVVPSWIVRRFERDYKKHNRNNALFEYFAHCARAGLTVATAIKAVECSTVFRNNEPLTKEELLEVCAKGFKAGN